MLDRTKRDDHNKLEFELEAAEQELNKQRNQIASRLATLLNERHAISDVSFSLLSDSCDPVCQRIKVHQALYSFSVLYVNVLRFQSFKVHILEKYKILQYTDHNVFGLVLKGCTIIGPEHDISHDQIRPGSSRCRVGRTRARAEL